MRSSAAASSVFGTSSCCEVALPAVLDLILHLRLRSLNSMARFATTISETSQRDCHLVVLRPRLHGVVDAREPISLAIVEVKDTPEALHGGQIPLHRVLCAVRILLQIEIELPRGASFA